MHHLHILDLWHFLATNLSLGLLHILVFHVLHTQPRRAHTDNANLQNTVLSPPELPYHLVTVLRLDTRYRTSDRHTHTLVKRYPLLPSLSVVKRISTTTNRLSGFTWSRWYSHLTQPLDLCGLSHSQPLDLRDLSHDQPLDYVAFYRIHGQRTQTNVRSLLTHK